jgi:alpha-galactosidase
VNRRKFCVSSAAMMCSSSGWANAFQVPQARTVEESAFDWSTPELHFRFSKRGDRLLQRALLPSKSQLEKESMPSGAEVAIQCTGENAIDSGTKHATGLPGARLLYQNFIERDLSNGKEMVIHHFDPILGLAIESYYRSFQGVAVVRRWTKLTNRSDKPVGIEYLSSSMLHGLADGQRFDHELLIHYAVNSWMAEGQWQAVRPLQMGFTENERTSWSEAEATSIGSWSTEKYLPMAVIENQARGLSWFWQIEHNGSWHWEVSNVPSRGNRAGDVYAYLGGPDALHSQAWKKLKPGESYETVPVALGCVHGGFTEAVQEFTRYRRTYCLKPRQQPVKNAVIFNDYMNCLVGDPTEEKELPLIDAAAAVGCEYYVIDAGWYAERSENWGETVGAWEPSKTRWPRGLKFVLDTIREKGMTPGLWLEPEVAGLRSPLASKPDDWFLQRHGKRFIHNSRLMLDFRNPAVCRYLDEVVDRCVTEYGAGYLKFDYNTTSLEGTDLNSDSLGQGLLEHNRALLKWYDGVLDRHPMLVIENCGSGAGRTDYAMLSHLQLQSVSDQEEYSRFPAIVTGASAGVIPEQMAVWSYPVENATADAASFNMVNALLGRIHQSGHLARLTPDARRQVEAGIALYKSKIRPLIPSFVPFYPLGMPKIVDHTTPIALGMKHERGSMVAVWRLEGESEVMLPMRLSKARLLYPSDLDISVHESGAGTTIGFPRPMMAALIEADV